AVGDIRTNAFRVAAIQRMDEEQLPVFGYVDGERAGRERDEVGEERDLQITIDLQGVGDEARLQVHVGRHHGDGDLHGRLDELDDEEPGQPEDAPSADEIMLGAGFAADQVDGKGRQEESEDKIGEGEGASDSGPDQRQDEVD